MTYPSNLGTPIGMLCCFDWGMEAIAFSPNHFIASSKGKTIKFGTYLVNSKGKSVEIPSEFLDKSNEFIIFVIANKSGDNCVLVKNDEELSLSISDNLIDGFKLKDLIKRKFSLEIEQANPDLLYDGSGTIQEGCSLPTSGNLDCIKV